MISETRTKFLNLTKIGTAKAIPTLNYIIKFIIKNIKPIILFIYSTEIK